MGKGSKRRPTDEKKYGRNHEYIFKKKKYRCPICNYVSTSNICRYCKQEMMETI